MATVSSGILNAVKIILVSAVGIFIILVIILILFIHKANQTDVSKEFSNEAETVLTDVQKLVDSLNRKCTEQSIWCVYEGCDGVLDVIVPFMLFSSLNLVMLIVRFLIAGLATTQCKIGFTTRIKVILYLRSIMNGDKTKDYALALYATDLKVLTVELLALRIDMINLDIKLIDMSVMGVAIEGIPALSIFLVEMFGFGLHPPSSTISAMFSAGMIFKKSQQPTIRAEKIEEKRQLEELVDAKELASGSDEIGIKERRKAQNDSVRQLFGDDAVEKLDEPGVVASNRRISRIVPENINDATFSSSVDNGVVGREDMTAGFTDLAVVRDDMVLGGGSGEVQNGGDNEEWEGRG